MKRPAETPKNAPSPTAATGTATDAEYAEFGRKLAEKMNANLEQTFVENLNLDKMVAAVADNKSVPIDKKTLEELRKSLDAPETRRQIAEQIADAFEGNASRFVGIKRRGSQVFLVVRVEPRTGGAAYYMFEAVPKATGIAVVGTFVPLNGSYLEETMAEQSVATLSQAPKGL